MLTLYKPEYSDLWFCRLMLADEETMAYNHAWGGAIDFPEERRRDWYDRWVENPGKERFYRYLVDDDGTFVGEIAYHFDEGIYLSDVIIYAKYRRKGFGRAGLKLLCAVAKSNGVDALCDNIAIDNPAIRLFIQCEFTEEYRTEEIIMLKSSSEHEKSPISGFFQLRIRCFAYVS